MDAPAAYCVSVRSFCGSCETVSGFAFGYYCDNIRRVFVFKQTGDAGACARDARAGERCLEIVPEINIIHIYLSH